MDRHKLHSLPDIPDIMFCGAICSVESWRDFVGFAESKLEFLRRFTPADSTLKCIKI
ncbi:MAG: transposase family protein [Pseudomonadales bacterium]|nr:transposase family protein [Pseudomonadales bacterium]